MWCGSLPSRGVSVLVEVDVLAGDPLEGRLEQVVEKLAAVDGVHGLAQPRLARAHLPVHVVEAVGHGVDCVYDEAHFAILNVVFVQALVSCSGGQKRQDIAVFFSNISKCGMGVDLEVEVISVLKQNRVAHASEVVQIWD